MSLQYNFLEKLALVYDNAEIGMAILTDSDRGILFNMVNPAFAALYGYESEEIIGKSPCDILAENCQFRMNNNSRLKCSFEDGSFETTHKRKDGTYIPVMVYSKLIRELNSQTYRIINVIDLTEKKKQDLKLREKEMKLASLAENLPGFVYTYLLSNENIEKFISISSGVHEILGLTSDEILENPDSFFSMIYENDLMELQKAFRTSAQENQALQYEFRISHPQKKLLWLETRAKTQKNTETGSIEWHGITLDITERKIAESKIEIMAHHDPLTWLPNRITAQKKMEYFINRANTTHTQIGLMFIDLDGFKTINDTLGHAVGDDLLKIISFHLNQVISTTDILCRHGGDEFLLILPDITNKTTLENAAKKLFDAFQKPFTVGEYQLNTTASIGITMYPDDGSTFERLLQNADLAMYHAKECGKNRHCFFNEQMKMTLLEQLKIETDLKAALQNKEFLLHYQPKIDLQSNTIVGVEALLRWNHPQLGLIPPMKFIPIAESSGLIVPIGKWIIEEACSQASIWFKQGLRLTIAVNISAIQFTRGNLEEVVINALNKFNINPEYLELELTESIIIHDAEAILQTVKNLKALGIQLSIDDFGTGYSSLAYLKRFAVDKLKIDRSFIRDIINNQEDAVIVDTIIKMANNLNLTTIAEGVEDQETTNLLSHLGCNEVQGYYFSKPLSSSDLEQFYSEFTK